MKKILNNQYIRIAFFVLLGIVIGSIMFHKSTPPKVNIHGPEKTIWTCAMHPQIRREAPGKCPICEMDLVPLNQLNTSINVNEIQLSDEAMQLANVQTVKITKQKVAGELKLFGKIKTDETATRNISAHVSGRVDKLFITFDGQEIHKGQVISEVYSPELITSQQEFIEAIKIKTSNPQFYEGAKEKLLQYNLTQKQIDGIEANQTIKSNIEIIAPISGVISKNQIKVGDYISRGQALFEVLDLFKVWAVFDVYEKDISLIKLGAIISFHVPSVPDKKFQGKIVFIEPTVDAVSRVSRIRVDVDNASGDLKPEMFVNGTILYKAEGNPQLIIPKTAVLWTGKQSLVYVKNIHSKNNMFEKQIVELGSEVGEYFVVLNGIREGEEVVSNGIFAVDASAQLNGKPSMMNQ